MSVWAWSGQPVGQQAASPTEMPRLSKPQRQSPAEELQTTLPTASGLRDCRATQKTSEKMGTRSGEEF